MTGLFFIGGGVCYLGMALSLLLEDRPWMAITFFLYAASIGTLYMGGKA